MRSSRLSSPGSPTFRRLRTAISPARSFTSTSSPVSSPPRALSPISGSSTPRRLSMSSMRGSLRTLLLLRRQPSSVDLEIEEEKRSFGAELNMLEPRPEEPVVGGIFEVLNGEF